LAQGLHGINIKLSTPFYSIICKLPPNKLVSIPKHVLKLHNSCLLTASACRLQDADREAAREASYDLWKRAEAITQAAPVVSAYDASQAHQQFAGAEDI